jgi:hypothetical protein
MTTRKRTVLGSEFSSDYSEEPTRVEETDLLEIFVQEKTEGIQKVKEVVPQIEEVVVTKTEAPKLEKKPEKKEDQVEFKPEVPHFNPPPSQTRELIRPRRNISRTSR